MIIRNQADAALLAETEDSYGMTGDPVELAEIAADLLNETHDLTIALARFEHRHYVALREAGGELTATKAEDKPEGGGMRAAAAEFFKKVGEKIVEFWEKFLSWLKHALAWIGEKVFGPRKIWLDKNKAALESKTEFGGEEVEIGKAVTRNSSSLASLPSDSIKVAEEMIAEATKASPGGEPQGGGSMADRVRAPLRAWLKTREEGASVVRMMEENFVGEMEKVGLSQGLVRSLIGTAEVTFANVGKMKESEGVARNAISTAKKLVAGSSEDEQRKGAVLRELSACGPAVSQMIGAAVAVNSKVCAQAMGALVRAAAAGAKKEPPAQQSANAGTSILDAYR